MPVSDILSLLASVMDFLDGQIDAQYIDGKLVPNEAMSLMRACEEAYAAIERAGGVANDL
jgi:hypothetical protein